MNIRSSREQDYKTVERWIDQDLFHYGKMTAEWWLPHSDPVAVYFMAVEDSNGPVIFIRIDKDNERCRFHMQFGPEDEVSKLRVAKALLKIFPGFVEEARFQKVSGIVFQSTSDPLISFMLKKGFVSCGNDDFLLQLEN